MTAGRCSPPWANYLPVGNLPSNPTADGHEPCGICGKWTKVKWRPERMMEDGLGGYISIPAIVHAACYYAQPPHESTKDRWPWKR